MHAVQCPALSSLPDENRATGQKSIASAVGYDVSGTVRLTLAALAREIYRSRCKITDVSFDSAEDRQENPIAYEWGLQDVLNLVCVGHPCLCLYPQWKDSSCHILQLIPCLGSGMRARAIRLGFLVRSSRCKELWKLCLTLAGEAETP